MITATLLYRSNVSVEDLNVGECTMHRAGNSDGARWWLLWFRVNRETDNLEETIAVPVNPNGPYIETGPGGKTWGFTGPGLLGAWYVSPSINVLNTKELRNGEHEAPSLWHQTPQILSVPDNEPWMHGAP